MRFTIPSKKALRNFCPKAKRNDFQKRYITCQVLSWLPKRVFKNTIIHAHFFWHLRQLTFNIFFNTQQINSLSQYHSEKERKWNFRAKGKCILVIITSLYSKYPQTRSSLHSTEETWMVSQRFGSCTVYFFSKNF